MGTLRIHGTIDLMQFWPIGSSDADTTKIKLEVSATSFEYKKKAQAHLRKQMLLKALNQKGK